MRIRAEVHCLTQAGRSNRLDVSGSSESGAWHVGVVPEVHDSARISPFPGYSRSMSAQRPQFDSYRFVKRLTTAGLPEEVAEILADEHTRLIVPDDVATKADVGAVRADLTVARADVEAVKADLTAVKADVEAVKADLTAVRADVEAVKADLTAVKADVEAVKADLTAVRADVEAVKADLTAVKADVEAVKADLTAVKADVEAVKADLTAVRADIEAVRTDFTATLHREIAASEARMKQRVQNAILEAKVSLIKWMIATMAVFSGIVIGAMTAFQ